MLCALSGDCEGDGGRSPSMVVLRKGAERIVCQRGDLVEIKLMLFRGDGPCEAVQRRTASMVVLGREAYRRFSPRGDLVEIKLMLCAISGDCEGDQRRSSSMVVLRKGAERNFSPRGYASSTSCSGKQISPLPPFSRLPQDRRGTQWEGGSWGPSLGRHTSSRAAGRRARKGTCNE